MKIKSVLTLIVSLLFTNICFSQKTVHKGTKPDAPFSENKGISICNSAEDKISMDELKKCPELTLKNKKLKIISFTASWMTKPGEVHQFAIKGNIINSGFLNAYQKDKPLSGKVFIENLMVSNGKKEYYYGFRAFYIQ